MALARGVDVIGSVRWRSKTEHIEHIRDRLTLVESDLRDRLSVRTVLEQARPDWIIHLAGQSFVHASWSTPVETFTTNVVSQMNLFEAMRQLGSKARFLVIGSRDVYAIVDPDQLPYSQNDPLLPIASCAFMHAPQDV